MTDPSSSTTAAGVANPTSLYEETRPWGLFRILLDLPHTKVKQIVVNPSARLSLQLHHKRQEHWVITKGQATVIVGDTPRQVSAGDTIHIPPETKHRIANEGAEPVEFIEVQLGSYFGEDDIVRFDDDYNRC